MKRFTETTKWANPWFRKLDPKFKALWLYLVDSCDVAGVWDADLESAAFHIGVSFEEVESLAALKERVVKMESGKWLLPKFATFQFGALNPENNCHKSVLKLMAIHKLEHIEGLMRPYLGPLDKEKVKETKNGKGLEEGSGEKPIFPANLDTPEFADAWKRWEKHRREIKKKLTPEMVASTFKRLSGYTVQFAIEVIEYTIQKGWQGLADEDQVKGNHGNSSNRTQSNQSERNSLKAKQCADEGIVIPIL